MCLWHQQATPGARQKVAEGCWNWFKLSQARQAHPHELVWRPGSRRCSGPSTLSARSNCCYWMKPSPTSTGNWPPPVVVKVSGISLQAARRPKRHCWSPTDPERGLCRQRSCRACSREVSFANSGIRLLQSVPRAGDALLSPALYRPGLILFAVRLISPTTDNNRVGVDSRGKPRLNSGYPPGKRGG